jgi:hypothetical protein
MIKKYRYLMSIQNQHREAITLLELVIFEVGPCFMHGRAWTSNLLSMLPCVAVMAGMYHHTQSQVEMGCHELFTPAALKL